MPPCPHPDELLYWSTVSQHHEAACNEAGWICGRCSARLGFRPDLDRRLLSVKVFSLLQDLHDHGFLYVSNGTLGEVIVENTVRCCRETGTFDQLSILQQLLGDPNVTGDSGCERSEPWTHGHARYWHDQAAEWLARGVVEVAPQVVGNRDRVDQDAAGQADAEGA